MAAPASELLGQFPDLAASLVVPKEDGKTATLSSYQLEILRDKNRDLTRRLHELSLNAQENETLSQHVHQLSLALMRANTSADVVKTLAASLKEDFGTESVRIVSFSPIVGVLADWYACIDEGDQRLVAFQDSLAAGEPICGRLNAAKIQVLFGDESEFTQSIALIPVIGIGMIAIGSADNHRFYRAWARCSCAGSVNSTRHPSCAAVADHGRGGFRHRAVSAVPDR